MKIENSKMELLINLYGGSYFDFHLKELPLNPISWRAVKPEERMFMGHFLCFDRWGPPTIAERQNGFGFHGEAAKEVWKLINEPQPRDGLTSCSMICMLPIGGLQLIREIELIEDQPVFFVTEYIKNTNKYGRMFNIVQHVSLAPPFLDKSTIFDNNTVKGFEDKEDGSLNQEKPILKWPEVDHNGVKVSLRHFRNEWPRVSSFVYSQNDKYGWVTACNQREKLMLGYLWKIEDYPWINFWRYMVNDVPMAFGMEFGTTGLHEPFPVVARKGKIFDQNIYTFIDANEVISKSFVAFLAKIPENYNGVEKIEISNSLLIIKEKNKMSQPIMFQTQDWF